MNGLRTGIKRIKRKITAQSANKCRIFTGLVTDTTVRVTVKNMTKRRLNARKTDIPFFRRISTGHITHKIDNIGPDIALNGTHVFEMHTG
jgi:hypothetical protein